MLTRTPNFNFLALIVFRDKEGVPKFNVGLLRPCRTPYAETFTYAPSMPASVPDFNCLARLVSEI